MSTSTVRLGFTLRFTNCVVETAPEILVALPDKIAEYTKRVNMLHLALINSVEVPKGGVVNLVIQRMTLSASTKKVRSFH